MLTHFAAVVLVVLAFLALYLRQLRYGEASTPNQRGAAANAGGVKRAVLIIMLAASASECCWRFLLR